MWQHMPMCKHLEVPTICVAWTVAHVAAHAQCKDLEVPTICVARTPAHVAAHAQVKHLGGRLGR